MILQHTQLTPLLESWKGKRCFFEPLHGNNGDRLIELGSQEAIRAAGIREVTSPAEAEVIVFNGGAGLTDVWEHAFRTLAEISHGWPQTPLVVMPSTIQYQDPAIIQNALAGREAPAYVFARERPTFDRLLATDLPPEVEVRLDHDMAFALSSSPWIDAYKNAPTRQHLVVERADREGVTGASERPVGRSSLKRFVPAPLKRHLKQRVLRRRSAASPFAGSVRDFLAQQPEADQSLPVVCFDASRPDLVSFPGFCRLIASSDCVVSTRLHVGILAAMLDKPTYVVSGLKKLGKIQGIYEHSLAESPNVRLLSYDAGQLSVV